MLSIADKTLVPISAVPISACLTHGCRAIYFFRILFRGKSVWYPYTFAHKEVDSYLNVIHVKITGGSDVSE